MTLYLKNKEGLEGFNIAPGSWENRRPGISAFIRLMNEEEFVQPAIESILTWVDEVVCTFQCSTDATKDIVASIKSDKIRMFDYPFPSTPNGPGHKMHPGDSVYSKEYFYNWSLSLTRHQWALKWDGDMVAMDWLGDQIRDRVEVFEKGDRKIFLCFNGINIVNGLSHTSLEQPIVKESQPRLFFVRPGVHYAVGMFTQTLVKPPGARTMSIEEPGYLHFKWAKKSCYQGWPENWQDIAHFQAIARRAAPGERYTGEIPTPLKGAMK